MEEGKELEAKVTGYGIAEKQDQPIILSDGLLTEEAIKRAELMVDGIKKIKTISIKVTNENDWSLQSGKPYLENTGCMKIAQLWGVNFINRRFEPEGGERYEDEKGTYWIYTCRGNAEFRGRVVEDIGTCSTRDDFFGTKKVDGEKVFKSPFEIDFENIKKKAVTNMQSRLLKKILGLSFTMEDLDKAGINLGKVTKINYAGGGKGGGTISEAQGKRLFAILAQGSKTSGEREERQSLLKAYLHDEFGIETTKEIERSNYEKVCSMAEKIAKELAV